MVAEEPGAERSVERETRTARDRVKSLRVELIIAGDHDLQPLSNARATSADLS